MHRVPLRSGQPHHLLNHPCQGQRLHRQTLVPREGQNVAHNPVQRRDGRRNLPHETLGLRQAPQVLIQHGRVELNGPPRVANLVRHARRHLTEGGQSFLARQLAVLLIQLAVQTRHFLRQTHVRPLQAFRHQVVCFDDLAELTLMGLGDRIRGPGHSWSILFRCCPAFVDGLP